MNMNFFKFGLLRMILLAGLTIPCIALSNYDSKFHSVAIDIIKDNGESFSIYPVKFRNPKNEYRAYLEAINGQNYGLRIRNYTNQRLGFVIAVDGRNIISGEKSHINYKENMYILGPYETQTYMGWRTSSSDIHRFYFTDKDDSYAQAFGDDTAIGVIAVAVYEENLPKLSSKKHKESAKQRAPSAGRVFENSAPAEDLAESEAGTGFGEHANSYARRVQFNPKRTELIKYFYKYEWRETLCHKQIIDCGTIKNRFWPHYNYKIGFAPYPPGYR